MHSYSFCALRYCHDPSVGESVNVGVLFYSPDAGFVRFFYDHHTAALSSLFRGFDRDEFLKFLLRFESAVERFQSSLAQARDGMFGIDNAPAHAGDLARWLVPDNGLSFQFGQVRAGISGDLLAASRLAFERQVTAQRPIPKGTKRRDDEAVWGTFYSPLRSYGITKVLMPYVAPTPDGEIPFKHAFKNENWHAIEPISFDYASASSIRDQALLWFAYGDALSETKEFSRLYLLLGAPTDPQQRADYARAKSRLAKMAIRPQLIEENEAEDFASDLASEMRKHGVLADEADEKMPTDTDDQVRITAKLRP